MHPGRHFREDGPAFYRDLVAQTGFGMVFCATPDGPRVAHTPVVMTGDDTLQFHVARGNALTRHLAEATALVVVNGTDAYISARWYSAADQVPTWNYTAAEFEGTVRTLEQSELLDMLTRLSAREEAGIAHGTAWTMDKMLPGYRDSLLQAIAGFEMTVTSRRATCKMSQNKPESVRAELIGGLEAEGMTDMAAAMRGERL